MVSLILKAWGLFQKLKRGDSKPRWAELQDQTATYLTN